MYYHNRDEIILALAPNHQYPTRHRARLRPTIHKHTLYEKSFLNQAPELWNEISHHLQLENLNNLTANQFKWKLKQVLLDN